MKRITLLFLVFWMLVPCGQAMAVSLSLEPASETAILGDEINFLLNISGLTAGGPDSLGAFSLDVTYDPMILAFSTVTFGNYLGDLDPLLFEADAYFDDSIPGVLYLDEVSFLSDLELDLLQPADFSLASLKFTGIGLGVSNVVLKNVVLVDALANELINPTLGDGSVTVTPVPEPATILLLAVGIGGLGFVRRRRLMSL
jgi:hypothetical protein